MITNIYVDGFNLYYGALRNSPYKWLNPLEMCRLVLKPHHRFNRLRYFTARVKARPHDPDKPARQESYCRALLTLPNTSLHWGSFLSHPVDMPLASDPTKRVRVLKTEEKGSDVNLATYLLVDAFQGDFECAVVVSNDSDLAEPIRFVKEEKHLTVLVLNPHRKPSVTLTRTASLMKDIREHHVKRAQFANELRSADGKLIRKPKGW